MIGSGCRRKRQGSVPFVRSGLAPENWGAMRGPSKAWQWGEPRATPGPGAAEWCA
jgi:hypothetical protein